jgi:hypothetical protein
MLDVREPISLTGLLLDWSVGRANVAAGTDLDRRPRGPSLSPRAPEGDADSLP